MRGWMRSWLFLLDGPAADLPEAVHLQPCLEQLTVPIHHAGDKILLEKPPYPLHDESIITASKGANKHVATLSKIIWIDIVLRSFDYPNLCGLRLLTSAVPHLSIEDYHEEDTDEVLGSVVAIPQLEVPYL
ncbi:hypothetical protein Tco_0624640 [Tanacetum coccineum]|uniref:Uncharacterized protein n=1 Tax=Tanacetum coccineum TaxID=301880 RepID=A0ABQ4WEM1_9ASTR